MKILTGGGTGPRHKEAIARGWGRLWGADERTIVAEPGEFWGLDNGAWGDYSKGNSFDGDRFMRNVERAHRVEQPISLAVLPDIIGGGLKSLERSLKWFWSGRLPDNFPWYLVLQDGFKTDHVLPYVETGIVGLFLGGHDIKGDVKEWTDFAHRYGLKMHYGRCSTENRVRAAFRYGCDSIDSTQPLWSKHHWGKFVSWVDRQQTELELVGD